MTARRMLFLLGAIIVGLYAVLNPHADVPVALFVVLAGVLFGPVLTTEGTTAYRVATAVAGGGAALIAAWLAQLRGGLGEPEGVYMVLIPMLILVVGVTDIAMVAACVAASTAGMAYLVANSPLPADETLSWAVTGGIISVIALLGAWLNAREHNDRVGEATSLAARVERATAEGEASQERAARGRQLADLCHEVNNPLSYVIGNLEHVRQQLGDGIDADLQTALNDAETGARRIASIVADLRRATGPASDVADVDDVVHLAARMAANQIQHRARLDLDLKARGTVGCDEVKLGQVVLNLLVNAAQAIESGDTTHQVVGVRTRNRGDEVLIEVTDTGTGVAAGARDRIFEPGFTTKSPDVGTGLGLAISREILREAGGSLELVSTSARGSTFRITLPARDAPESDTLSIEVVPPAKRVLVIDDDPLVLRSIVRRLSREYQVDSQPSATAALGLDDLGTYDAVLCDVMMPDVSGPELHARLLEREPLVARRLVFMTGGAFDASDRRALEATGQPVLAKPLDIDMLRRVLHDG